MVIMAVHQTPSLTQERYEEVVRRLTNRKRRMRSVSDLPFDGLLVHVAGQGEKGFCVVDVFASQDAVDAFNEALGSIPREVGIEQPPDFFPAHTFVAEWAAVAAGACRTLARGRAPRVPPGVRGSPQRSRSRGGDLFPHRIALQRICQGVEPR